MCTDAYTEFSTIFALMSLTSACSGIVFEPISRAFGMFAVRLTMCLFSIVGHVCLIFYQDDPNMIYIGWNMMGFSTFIYLTSNINEQAARWPEKEPGVTKQYVQSRSCAPLASTSDLICPGTPE